MAVSIAFLLESIPTTSAPIRASGSVKIPPPQPISRIRMFFLKLIECALSEFNINFILILLKECNA